MADLESGEFGETLFNGFLAEGGTAFVSGLVGRSVGVEALD